MLYSEVAVFDMSDQFTSVMML